MTRRKFSILRILRYDGFAIACQLWGVLALLGTAPVWLVNRLLRAGAVSLLDHLPKWLLGFVLICVVCLAVRILLLVKILSRAILVRAEAVPVDRAVRWIPLAVRIRYPLRVSFEVDGTRHSSQLYVWDAEVYRRVEQEGLAEVIFDPQSWNVYPAELYLESQAAS